jgi:phenylalanyl-tRNA synthetase beta chain
MPGCSIGAQIGALGWAGEVHPEVRERFGVAPRCFYLELNLEAIAELPPVQFVPLPRFPSISRDLSCFVDLLVPAARFAECVRERAEPLLVDVRVLEDYRDPERVPAGKKSMLWSMTYRSAERTLTDEEASAAHARIVAHLQARLGIQPR